MVDLLDKRKDLIKSYIKDKDVLDVGCGDVRVRGFHYFICNNSKSCSGLELEDKRVVMLRKKGYNVFKGNAECYKLNKKFDVVFAGDIIEHVNNVGLFIDNMNFHLKDDGIFIVSTNNAYSINLLFRGLFLGKVDLFKEHVNNFTEQLLREYMVRHNFKVVKFVYFNHEESNFKSFFIRFMSIFNKHFCEYVLVFAVKKINKNYRC